MGKRYWNFGFLDFAYAWFSCYMSIDGVLSEHKLEHVAIVHTPGVSFQGWEIYGLRVKTRFNASF
jgi:hypothetical protein